METKQYKLRYLPRFRRDLSEILNYLTFELHNPMAAESLVDEVDAAIIKRLSCPEAFEAYLSARERQFPYYRIYVKNYIIFYVVIDDVVEIRRILYSRRHLHSQL